MKKIVGIVVAMIFCFVIPVSMAYSTPPPADPNQQQRQNQRQQQQQQQQQRQNQRQTAIGVGGSSAAYSNSQGGNGGAGGNGYGGAGGNASAQGGSVDINDSMNSNAQAGFELNNSFNQIPLRDFPIPGSVVFPMTPGYFGPSTPSHNFIPLSKLTMYSIVWNYDEIENMIEDKGGWTKNSGLDVQIRHLVKNTNENKDENEKVFTTTTKPKNASSIKQLAFATAVITDDHKISPDVFARLLKECHDAGGNVIHFLAEGIDRKMRASGWGIGINNSTAVMSNGQGLGNVAVGGTGYSNGTSGYIDRPWLQAIFLKVTTNNDEPIEFYPAQIKKNDLSELRKRLDRLEARENSGTFVKDSTR